MMVTGITGPNTISLSDLPVEGSEAKVCGTHRPSEGQQGKAGASHSERETEHGHLAATS